MEKFEKVILSAFLIVSLSMIGTNIYYTYQIGYECPSIDEPDEDTFDETSLDVYNYYIPKVNITLIANETITAIWDAEELNIERTGVSLSKFENSKYDILIQYLNNLSIWFSNTTGSSEVDDYENIEYDILNITNHDSVYPTDKIEIWADANGQNSHLTGTFNPKPYIIDSINYQTTLDSSSNWQEKRWSREYNDRLQITFNYSLNQTYDKFAALFDLIDEHILENTQLSENSTIANFIIDEVVPDIEEKLEKITIDMVIFHTYIINIGDLQKETDDNLSVSIKMNSTNLMFDSLLTFNE